MTTMEDVKARFVEGWTPYLPGKGWDNILIEMHDAVVAADPEIKYIQIKEKFGELRVYLRPVVSNDEAMEAVQQAVIKSRETCETCGQPGELRETRSWVLTLCDACEEARNASTT